MLVEQYNTHTMTDRSALDSLVHTNSVSIEVSPLFYDDLFFVPVLVRRRADESFYNWKNHKNYIALAGDFTK